MVLIYSVLDANGLLLKHLTPRPGGIIDSLTKPKVPGGGLLSSHLGGGISFGLGNFGFNLGFNKQYRPGGVNLPPKDPHVPGGETGYPEGNPYVPGVKPGYPEDNPYVPGYPNGNPYVPGYPNGNPYVPGAKPVYPDENPYIPKPKPVIPQNPAVNHPKPGMTWEDEEDEKAHDYPPSKDKDYSKPDEKDYAKPGSYQETGSPKREDKRPDWEDIGEVYEKDPKSENYMDSDLVGDGLIQPRLNKKRNKRFIESKIYHVPLMFRSNAKPSRVKIHNSLNSINKDVLEI